MNNLETWTAFFGWLTIVNLVIYVITAGGVTLMRGFMLRMNSRMFGIDEADVARIAFQYVGAYKLLITVFCFAPWVALKLMA